MVVFLGQKYTIISFRIGNLNHKDPVENKLPVWFASPV